MCPHPGVLREMDKEIHSMSGIEFSASHMPYHTGYLPDPQIQAVSVSITVISMRRENREEGICPACGGPSFNP